MNAYGCLAHKCGDILRKALTHRKILIEVRRVTRYPLGGGLLGIELSPLMLGHTVPIGFNLTELLHHTQMIERLLRGKGNSGQPAVAVAATAADSPDAGEINRHRWKGKSYCTAASERTLHLTAQTRQFRTVWQHIVVDRHNLYWNGIWVSDISSHSQDPCDVNCG